MSSIHTSLATDAPPASRALSARNRPQGRGAQFSELLTVKSATSASRRSHASAKDDDAAPDTVNGSGGTTGNAMRQEPAPLPPPDITAARDDRREADHREADRREADRRERTAAIDGTDRRPDRSDTGSGQRTDAAPPQARAAEATAAPAGATEVDTALLDMLARANGLAPTGAGDAGARPTFRLVADPAALATPLDAPLPQTAVMVPQGPLSVTVPGEGTSVMSLFGGALRGLCPTTGGKDEGGRDEGGRDEIADALNPTATTGVDTAALGAADGALPVAAAAGAGDGATLDMTQQHWPQTMIDRIARMRDDAATADTRIRLSPDALGGIAVAIRQGDGATHIHFTAEQARTATLLADAHATLHRLAEEKGMRLGETAVNGGGTGPSGGEQRPAPQPQPGTPPRARANPFSEAASDSIADTAPPSSTRIA